MSRCEEEQTNSPTQEDEDEDDSKADEVAGLFTAELLALSEGGFLSGLLVSNAAYFTDQLVLPALRHLRTNGPAVIDVLQLLDKVVGRSDAGISYLEFCKDRIFARLAVDCMTNPSTAELIKALKEYQAELPFTLPKKSLLDEMPTLYRSLLREMEDVSEKLLVESVVFSKLKSLAALMGVAISESVAITVGVTDHGPRGSNLSVATYHRMLLPILWDLGRGSPADVTTGSAVPSRSSDADTQQQQLKAVRVLSFQAKENSWQLLSRRNRHIAEELNSAVADKLQVGKACIGTHLPYLPSVLSCTSSSSSSSSPPPSSSPTSLSSSSSIIICSGGFPLHFGQPVGKGLAAAVRAISGPVPSLSETRHRATQACRLGEVLAEGDAI